MQAHNVATAQKLFYGPSNLHSSCRVLLRRWAPRANEDVHTCVCVHAHARDGVCTCAQDRAARNPDVTLDTVFARMIRVCVDDNSVLHVVCCKHTHTHHTCTVRRRGLRQPLTRAGNQVTMHTLVLCVCVCVCMCRGAGSLVIAAVIPRDFAMAATLLPMLPLPPMRPMVLPPSSKCGVRSGAENPLVLSPAQISLCCSMRLELQFSMNVMTSWATASWL